MLHLTCQHDHALFGARRRLQPAAAPAAALQLLHRRWDARLYHIFETEHGQLAAWLPWLLLLLVGGGGNIRHGDESHSPRRLVMLVPSAHVEGICH
jgi:hypothetical protein